jgi:hypothetical protein
MRKKTTIIALLGLGIFACTQVIKKQAVPPYYFCNTSISDSLCSGLPYDVREIFGDDYNTDLIKFTNPASKDSAQQTPLDLFSWQTFVALNWPADGSGNPTGSIMDTNLKQQRVWEHYTDPAEVFNDPQSTLALHLKTSKENSRKFFYMFSKAPHSLVRPGRLGDFTEADGNPLIDRNGNFTLYEIKINPVEVNFITTNKLTSVDSIFAYNPAGFTLPKSDSAKKTNGAIEIKSSWRILTDTDNASLFYCRMADIYIDSLHTDSKLKLVIRNVKVGLVGMHIIRSTSSIASNFLIWSTFEHIDNAPPSAAAAQNTKWSYYNQACTTCTPNTPPALAPGQNQFIWDTLPPYAKFYTTGGYGTQVIRLNSVFSYTDSVNNKWQAKLKNTVWTNYRLIGTQWQVNTYGVPNNPFPRSMSNTTMETFMQGNSCIGCHGGATVTYTGVNPDSTYNIPTGMSFLFPVYAKPQQGLQADRKMKK